MNAFCSLYCSAFIALLQILRSPGQAWDQPYWVCSCGHSNFLNLLSTATFIMSSNHSTHSLHCEFHNSLFCGPAGISRFYYKMYSEKTVDNSPDKIWLTLQLLENILLRRWNNNCINQYLNFSSLHISFKKYFFISSIPIPCGVT